MLVFNVTFRCKAGMRALFLEKLKAEGVDAASRAEAGNLQYDYFLADGNDTDLLLIEKYRDDDAVLAHTRQPHVARMVALKEEYVDELILERYEKTEEYNCSGAPSSERRSFLYKKNQFSSASSFSMAAARFLP